ncbi:hypothetical protein ACWGDT_10545 [Streptomyces avermitilis]
MKSTSVCRVTVSIVVGAVLAGVAACDSPDSGKDDRSAHRPRTHVRPVTALRSVEKTTDGADSAKVESTTTMGTLMTMKADGVLGWADDLTGNLTITYTGGMMADTMRQAGATSMPARYLPDAYYARMGDTFAERADGKHWVKYAYDDLAKLPGGSGAYLKDQMRNTTPNQSVKLLLASRDVRKVGAETVRGEQTTHYTGTVSVADLATENSSLTARQVSGLKRQLTQAGVTTETVDIWVNSQDLLVKKVEKGEPATGRMSSTAYYSDYGVKVAAQEPPAGDTTDFKDLIEQHGDMSGSPDNSSGSGATP